jgi:ABC-type uncharacterized transport system auxiliary subunit
VQADFKMKHIKPMGFIGLILLMLAGSGCNRAALRIPGASLSFPAIKTGYTARTNFHCTVVVARPSDCRPQHYDEPVARTKWTAVSTDATLGSDATKLIRQRMVEALQTSGLFTQVATQTNGPDDVILKTEVDAFCSQVRGFLIDRVVGITSLQVTLEQNGRVLSQHQFEAVVTDADPEYTGSQVTMIEQAMKVTMMDSLRVAMKKMLARFETDLSAAPPNAGKGQ